MGIRLYIKLWTPVCSRHTWLLVDIICRFANPLVSPRPPAVDITVVLTCCKGDGQSQWKTPILGPHSSETP